MNESSFPLHPSERQAPDRADQFVLSGRRYRNLIACEAVLQHLSNEVLGSLPLMEPLCRREFGNTNYHILITTAERARELLKKT